MQSSLRKTAPRRGRLLAAALAVAALGAPIGASAAQFINILTGGTSGVYYPMGVALQKIYTDGISGARVQVQATKASVENLNLLQQGKGEIAFSLGDSVKLAWEGDAEAGFKAPLDKLRGVAAIYPNYVQIVASKESGINTLADLKGKSLSVGAAKSGTELNARAILEAAGMSYDDLSKVEYLPFAESVELMKNRQLDATLQSAGLGVASLKDLATSVPITVVAVPEDVVTKLGAPYQATTIPAGTYQGQDAEVPGVAVQNFLITHEGVPEEEVYQMTKLMYEHLDGLRAAHSAAQAIDPAKALEGMPLPLHPGAEKYYREAGILK
ncbi:C4-dicarboxylate ABC transporter [Paracoccus suum]|uniref:C4-dicarboxylate ABC transporter n=1 Tax=Paracoccus suum TaxID=2259340 RepID=A0A344PJS3_9RHOB|nr:TAXI family TRAP transporter solute-binding subunit [Paracoccus suum]AXC49628.1 C4-dicarboxylate ABC transporter [Paracoccus suum]